MVITSNQKKKNHSNIKIVFDHSNFKIGAYEFVAELLTFFYNQMRSEPLENILSKRDKTFSGFGS